MSPWLSNSAVTMDLLQEAGYRYVMDWTMDDQPIWIRTRKGRILTVPYPIEVNDTRGIIWYHYTSEEFADMIVDQFDEMLAQSARQPLVCPISLHPFVFGRPYRIRRLRQALQHILQHQDRVWLTRPREICAHIESLPAGGSPAAADRRDAGSGAACFVVESAVFSVGAAAPRDRAGEEWRCGATLAMSSSAPAPPRRSCTRSRPRRRASTEPGCPRPSTTRAGSTPRRSRATGALAGVRRCVARGPPDRAPERRRPGAPRLGRCRAALHGWAGADP